MLVWLPADELFVEQLLKSVARCHDDHRLRRVGMYCNCNKRPRLLHEK